MPEEKMSKIERDQARERIEKYHQKKLAELMEIPQQKILDARSGKISTFEADYAIHVYHEQSRELFGFINSFYEQNVLLPKLLELIDLEEKGEWRWEPEDNCVDGR